jgi:hypothetical protein
MTVLLWCFGAPLRRHFEMVCPSRLMGSQNGFILGKQKAIQGIASGIVMDLPIQSNLNPDQGHQDCRLQCRFCPLNAFRPLLARRLLQAFSIGGVQLCSSLGQIMQRLPFGTSCGAHLALIAMQTPRRFVVPAPRRLAGSSQTCLEPFVVLNALRLAGMAAGGLAGMQIFNA